VTGRFVPVVAVADTCMVAVIVVESATWTLEKVTPLGPLMLAPAAKPVPMRVTEVVVPWAARDGFMEAMVGAAMMVKHPMHKALE
jgi:hypothetical protein